MKRRRSYAVLLAASLAAMACPMPFTLSADVSTRRATPDTQPGPTTQPATTFPAVAQVASTQPNATQPSATEPATTQVSTTQPATQEAATQPFDADHPPATIRLNFRDVPLDLILEKLSEDGGFSVVKEASVDDHLTVISMQPLTPSQAVALLNAVLKGEGLAALQEGRTLRIVARDKAKKGNLPVHYGAEPSEVEISDSFITQVIPVHNVEAVKLKQDLMPLIGPDADVAANAGANVIVMTDTSANVRRIVEIINLMDKREGTTSTVKIIPLKNARASSAAKLVLAIFRGPLPQPVPGQPPQPQPPVQPRESRLLGTGVDQALYGGKVTAGADVRTNSLIVAAPADAMKEIEAMVQEIDQNPATEATPAIKTFHLKFADATAVALAVRKLFDSDDAQPGQSHALAAEDSLHEHVTVVPEERTNTLIVTAPPVAMLAIDGLIRDVDGQPAEESMVRAYLLKYADATATAKALMQIFIDPLTGQSRLQLGAREKVSATADARTNTVFVTAPAKAFDIVEQTVKNLDAGPTNNGNVKFFHLKQGDADATAKLILSFFKPPEGAATDHRPPDAVHVGVNAVADSRTNTVAVTAPEAAMGIVEKIVQEIESEPTVSLDIQSFPLKNGDASTAAKLLTTLFQPDPATAGSGANKGTGRDAALRTRVVAAADDRTNTVVVTAPAETLRIIEGMMKLLDAGSLTGTEIQMFQLVNADSLRAGKMLESIFQPAVLQGLGTPASNAPKPPGALDAIRKLGWVSTASDERTNTLIVTAPAEAMKVVSGIVRQIDADASSQESFFIYRLRNAEAPNLETVLNRMFGATQQTGASASATTQRPGAAGQMGAASAGAPGLGSSSALGLGSSVGAGGTGIGARYGTVTTPGSTPNATTPNLPASLAGAVSNLSGQVYVVADVDTNSLMVTTATRYKSEVRDIIAELDRSVPQVLIKVLVAEVSHDNSADWGLDFSILNNRPSGMGTVTSQNMGNAAAGAANGGLVVSMLESQVNATLHALATEGKLDVLSRPYILASDNQLASITVGQEVPFITNTQITDTGQQINTIQYQDVGIILNVTPHINPEGLVILDVAPEISQLTGSTVPISSGVAAPIIDKRAAQSRVAIQDGQTIVIGGLMQDNKTSTISKIPIIGDIPIIGEIFKRTQIDKTKTELLIFLTPHVAQQPSRLRSMSEDEMNGTTLTPHAVEPGVFDEHIQGMRRGHSPDSRPSTEPIDPVREFSPATSQQGADHGTQSSGPIPLQ